MTALTLSGVNFYANYPRVTHSLRATFLKVHVETEKREIFVDVGIFNDGNQPEIIADGSVSTWDLSQAAEDKWNSSGLGKSPDLPTVVKGGEMRIVRVQGNLYSVYEFEGLPSFRDTNQKQKYFGVGVTLGVRTSSGYLLETKWPVADVTVSRESKDSFGFGYGVRTYQIVDLLKAGVFVPDGSTAGRRLK